MVMGCVVWGLFHGRGKRFCSSSEHLNRLWVPEYWSSSRWGKVDHLHLVQRLRMELYICPPCIPSKQAQGHLSLQKVLTLELCLGNTLQVLFLETLVASLFLNCLI